MAKNINSTADIVPVSVLMNIAKRVRSAAAGIAKAKNVPLRSANEIGIAKPTVTQAQISVNLTLSSKLSAYEWGSGEKRKRGTPAKYSIRPKNARALVFPGTNEFEGQIIITQHVAHPGVSPRPFLGPAKRQTRQQNLADIRAATRTNLTLVIRGMAKKI